MIKKILCLLFALSLCAVFPAAAEESSPLPVTAQELSALLQSRPGPGAGNRTP